MQLAATAVFGRLSCADSTALFATLSAALAIFLLGTLELLRRSRVELRASHESRERLAQDRLQLSSLEGRQHKFIAEVTHELRTPLTSIHGALTLLQMTAAPGTEPRGQHLLRIASQNTTRLISLINDLLDLERMDSGSMQLAVSRCNMHDLCQAVIESTKPLADAAKVHLRIDSALAASATYFDGDGDRLTQVLINLVGNAIKFSPAGGVVSIDIQTDADSIQLSVSDQGRGIPAAKLETIFERFQQVEESDARSKGGTGLGLAISRTIVAAHNGTIWAESNEAHQRGPGSSFFVSLPRISRVEDAQTVTRLTTLRPAPDRTIALLGQPSDSFTIAAGILRGQRYKVVELSAGQAIPSEAEALVLDLTPAAPADHRFLERVAAARAASHLPTLILSNLSPSEAIARGLESLAQAQGWLQRPYSDLQLTNELERILQVSGKPARILLVEDDADLASLVIATMQQHHLAVEHAGTRQSAIERFQSARPDLLLLDLSLPDGDGFSLVSWMRQQPALDSLPVVVYSAREVSDDERIRLRLGPTRFLTKSRAGPRELGQVVMDIVLHEQSREPARLIA